MRRMILTSLVLLPVMAHAQASTSTEPQPSSSSAMLQAEVIRPSLAAATAPAAAAIPAISTTSHAAIREFVQTKTTDNFVDAALMKGGTVEFALRGNDPTESSAPKVTRAVEMELSAQELADQPVVSSVVVHAIVDENGIPRNVVVSRSGGPVIDRKAVAAVSQYRFKPATLDNKPTWASVEISIKVQKP